MQGIPLTRMTTLATCALLAFAPAALAESSSK